MKIYEIWGKDIYDYIKMCNQLGENLASNYYLGINGPNGIGKKVLLKTICDEFHRKFIYIDYDEFIKQWNSLNDYLIELNSRAKLIYIGQVLLERATYKKELEYIVEKIEETKKIKNCIFVFSSEEVIGSNIALDIRFKIFRYGCLSLEEKKLFAQIVVQKCQKELDLSEVQLPEASVEILVKHYTKEAGVNQLTVLIQNLYERVLYERMCENKGDNILVITNKVIRRVLGYGCYVFDEQISKRYVQGIGVAWSKWGGEILPIQIEMLSGKGNLIYSGHIGSIMRQSAEVVLQYLKINFKSWKLRWRDINRKDFYISIYKLGLEKDGASAGLAFFINFVCQLKQIKFKQPIAFSGEVSLDGRVLRVGGLKEKICVAKMYGIFKIVLPRQSWAEYQTLSKSLREDISVYFIDEVEELKKIIDKEQEV